MDERELKLRHTSEGAEKVRADVESVAQAEGKLGDAVDGAGKSTEELRIRKQSLLTVLNRIHPGLGAYVDSLLQAARVTGELGNVNITLEGILGGVQAAVLKNASALALLGAGGAAVAAVMFLIHQIRALKSELEDVLKLQDRIAEQNRKLIDKALVFEEMLVEAVEAGEVPPPDEERKKAMRAGYQKSVAEGLSEKKAFDDAVGQDFVSDEQREFIRATRGEMQTRQRTAEELSKGKELSSRDLEFITKQGFTKEGVDKLRNVIDYGRPEVPYLKPGVVDVTGIGAPMSPDELQTKEPQLYELAARLGLLKLIVERLGQGQPRKPGIGFQKQLPTLRNLLDFSGGQPAASGNLEPETPAERSLRLNSPSEAEREARGPWGSPQRWEHIQKERTGPDQSAAMLREAARDLNAAARNMLASSEHQRNVTDRAAQRLSSNGTTPRMVAAIGREG